MEHQPIGAKGESVPIGRFLRVLAGAAGTVIAVGCGTQHAPSVASDTPDLAAAVSHTQDQTARVVTTISTRTQGTSVSFTATGLFDFARSRGMLSIPSPVDMTEVFVPPTTYIKAPGADGGGLPAGKTWTALPDGTVSASAMLGLGGGGGDPADLLSSLRAMSGAVTKIGTTTIRGVPVTGFALTVDPAKAGSTIPGTDRAPIEALVKVFGTAEIPVDVWVDGQNLVRREKLSLAAPSGEGAPAGTRIVVTTDFYDFGVRVRVSAPPASLVATEQSQIGGGASGSGTSPPPASGTLSPTAKASAEQAVTAFWAALGSNSEAAVERAVVPAQRSCVSALMGGGGNPTITVSSLHITSAQPAGKSSATVRFTVRAQATLAGRDIPVFPQGPGSTQWLATAEVAGHWYVNLADSTALVFAGGCA
jgi:hypothetical protein